MNSIKNSSIENFTLPTSIPINDCSSFKMIGVYLIVVFMLSIISNSILIWIFVVTKTLRKPTDILIISLTLNNLMGTVLFLPPIIVSNFTCG